MRFDGVSITLVGPEYPINVGYTARLAKNFGIHRLYLVEPKFDRRVASVYAAHGADIVEAAEVVNLKQLRERHDLLVATTAITATKRTNSNRLSISPEEVSAYLSSSKSASLVLGRDTTGLKNDEIAKCDIVTTIHTGTEYRTLNVSHSAAILLYVLSKTKKRRTVPKLRERDVFVMYAYQLALASGLQKYRADRLKKLAARMAIRSQLDGKELGLFVSLMRKATTTIESSTGARIRRQDV
ncbi:MAG: RNA methyltransferase [Nitrososphaerota archaeon]|nr:RNA methyltransferase [Nitrososphaerota archaeon]